MLSKEHSFYQEMQNCPGLDKRDNRGKTHSLAFVLVGVLLGLLRGRDGVLSSIHRSMENNNEALCMCLAIPTQQVVSRPHLPVILSKVDVEVFDNLLFNHYSFRLNANEKEWFSGDGKDLRGSIACGKKRGEAIVQLVHHQSGEVFAQNYYNGHKESEKPRLRDLLSQTQVASQKVTLDALHFYPETIETILGAGGIFLIGLKSNQPKLLAKMSRCARKQAPIYEESHFDDGHGRFERRKYELYDVSQHQFDKRWPPQAFMRLIRVERSRIDKKSGKISRTISYHVTNDTQKEGIFDAVRDHWGIEVNNYIRDITLKEDQLKSKKQKLQRTISGLRTLAVNLLKKETHKSLIAQIELFQDDFNALLAWLKKLQFL